MRVFVAALVLALAMAAPAAAQTTDLTDVQLTLNRTSGGGITRFTFIANTGVPVSSVSLDFPEGFDIDEANADVVTLEGLKRTPIEVEQETVGSRLTLRFTPDVAVGSTMRVQVHNVRLPNKGGRYTLGATYVSDGEEGSLRTPAFTFETVTTSEQLSRWLDRQAWVRRWNQVPFFGLFVRPQQIALAVPLLFKGWLMSVALVGVAFPFAIVGGLVLAFMKMAKVAPIRWVANLYINVIRGTPLFLQIYIAFVGLPIAGFRAPLFVTGIVVLALNSSAYLAEIFRAGIQSIHKGQMEAASSLGMSYGQAMAFVIVPQTVKRVLPTTTSEFILLFKDTALLSAVGVFELMLYSNSIATRSGNLTPFVVAAVYYLLVTIPLINWVSSLEARLAVAEGGQATTKKPNRNFFGSLSRTVDPDRAGAPDSIAPSPKDEG